MAGAIIGFIIWAIVGCIFFGLGLCSFFSKSAVGFWANTKMYKVNDVKKYNHAMGKLWMAFGIVFIALGLPLFDGQNSPWILFSIIGVMAETIVLMIIYTLVITPKYQKK